MNQPVILLVESNSSQARLISLALAGLGLPRPEVVGSGEEAVARVGARRCDVCVLDHHLPGIDGLETLRLIRARRPELPVILLAAVQAEQVVGAALRAGAAGCVAKAPGFADAVARLVQRLASPTTPGAPRREGHVAGDGAARLAQPAAPGTPVGVARAEVADQLARPTYQNRLRVIGRHLDLGGCRALNLLEVGGSSCHPGFLLRALPRGGRDPEALEFLDRDFPQRVARALAARGEGERGRSMSPLLPTGYEDFLRAVGHRLDLRQAAAITVAELDGLVAVGGVGRRDGAARGEVAPFQDLLRPEDVADLLDEAFRRRAPARTAALASVSG